MLLRVQIGVQTCETVNKSVEAMVLEYLRDLQALCIFLHRAFLRRGAQRNISGEEAQ